MRFLQYISANRKIEVSVLQRYILRGIFSLTGILCILTVCLYVKCYAAYEQAYLVFVVECRLKESKECVGGYWSVLLIGHEVQIGHIARMMST